jgi:large subunit ribosomal protein L25
MKRFKLAVEKRKVLGKKVHKLRKEGIFPANIYGKGVKSVAVQVPYKDFEKVYKEAGVTGIVDVDIAGEVRPSLIHNVQQDYYKHLLLHADFFQVNLKEKVKTMVKLVTVGEPKAVSEKLGLLMQTLAEVEIEALPTDLPDKIEVNVESLAVLDAQVTVGEIKTPTGVTILTDPSQVVAKIGSLISKEAAEQAAAEAAAAEAAKAAAAPAATTEGTAPAEGTPAAPTAAAKQEEKPQK